MLTKYENKPFIRKFIRRIFHNKNNKKGSFLEYIYVIIFSVVICAVIWLAISGALVDREKNIVQFYNSSDTRVEY